MKTDAEQLWESAQAMLRSLLHTDIYEFWFAPVRAVGMDDTTVTLEVADDFCEAWLTQVVDFRMRTAQSAC